MKVLGTIICKDCGCVVEIYSKQQHRKVLCDSCAKERRYKRRKDWYYRNLERERKKARDNKAIRVKVERAKDEIMYDLDIRVGPSVLSPEQIERCNKVAEKIRENCILEIQRKAKEKKDEERKKIIEYEKNQRERLKIEMKEKNALKKELRRYGKYLIKKQHTAILRRWKPVYNPYRYVDKEEIGRVSGNRLVADVKFRNIIGIYDSRLLTKISVPGYYRVEKTTLESKCFYSSCENGIPIDYNWNRTRLWFSSHADYYNWMDDRRMYGKIQKKINDKKKMARMKKLTRRKNTLMKKTLGCRAEQFFRGIAMPSLMSQSRAFA